MTPQCRKTTIITAWEESTIRQLVDWVKVMSIEETPSACMVALGSGEDRIKPLTIQCETYIITAETLRGKGYEQRQTAEV